MKIELRYGHDTDANAAIAVLRRSITELCRADHNDEVAEISAWLSNKTEQSWKSWVARKDADLLVAERDGSLVGIAMVDHAGEVLLLYVAPQTRYAGVSKALLSALEVKARTIGIEVCFVESTVTAYGFYYDRGYRPSPDGGLHLKKRL